MREPDAFARLVLRAGPAEQVEDAFVIARIDSAPVIGDLDDRAAMLGPPGTYGTFSDRIVRTSPRARASSTRLKLY